MSRLVLSQVSTALVVLALCNTRALADQPTASMQPTLVAKVRLGLGGTVTETGSLPKNEHDLAPGTGGALHYEYPLAELFVLGGYFGVTSWNTVRSGDLGHSRSALVDVALLPKLRYAPNEQVELSLAVPVGLALDFNSGDAFRPPTARPISMNVGPGISVQGLVGGQFEFADDLGLMGEMGYGLTYVSHTFNPKANAGSPALSDIEVDLMLQHFVVTLGFFYRL